MIDSGRGMPTRQRGMVLLVSLILLLLLTLAGVTSMQSATMQEKMAGSVSARNDAFQRAETALRVGENAVAASTFTLTKCATVVTCTPPAVTTTPPSNSNTAGVTWVAASTDSSNSADSWYGVQNLGTTTGAVNLGTAAGSSATLYRITSVAQKGQNITVLESIYAKW